MCVMKWISCVITIGSTPKISNLLEYEQLVTFLGKVAALRLSCSVDECARNSIFDGLISIS